MSGVEEVTNLLECSICLELCTSPVQQCLNGHNICGSHLRQLTDLICPTCRVPYARGCVRNLLAEKLILQKKKELEEQKAREAATGTHKLRNGNVAVAQTSGHGQNTIKCYLEADGCKNSQIPFAHYLSHLKTIHHVKCFREPGHVHKYFLNASKKLVRNGSSSLFIMEAFQQSFLIAAKEINGRVFILVAAHALGSEQQFLAKMELLVKRKEGERVGQKFTKTCPIRSTARSPVMTSDLILRADPSCFPILESDIMQNLEEQSPPGGNGYARKYWSLRVTISRQAVVRGGQATPTPRPVTSQTPTTSRTPVQSWLNANRTSAMLAASIIPPLPSTPRLGSSTASTSRNGAIVIHHAISSGDETRRASQRSSMSDFAREFYESNYDSDFDDFDGLSRRHNIVAASHVAASSKAKKCSIQ